jgi:hypothetical protein
MARIPIYQQQQVPNAPGAPVGRALPVAAAGSGTAAIGQGLERIAGALERGEQVQSQIDRDAFEMEMQRIQTEGRVWAATTSSRFDLDMTDYAQRARTSASPGAPGFVGDFMKNADELIKQTLETAPSQFAREQLTPMLTRSREAFGRQAIAFEAGERARYTGQQLEDGIRASSTLVAVNPGLFADEFGKWGSTIAGAAPLGAEGQAKVREFARAQLVNAAVIGWIDRNPPAARAVLAEMASDPAAVSAQIVLPGPDGRPMSVPVNLGTLEERRRWMQYAEGKAGAAREAVQFRLEDAIAAGNAGRVYENPPTRDELVVAFGPERGARLADNLASAQRFGSDLSRMSAMTPDEIDALVASRVPTGTATAQDQARFEQLQRAAAQSKTDRQRDGATWVQANSPVVRQAYESLTRNPMDPQAAQEYAAASVAEQRRLGVAEPKILPAAVADSIARSIRDVEAQPQEVARTLQAYAQTWGRSWPQVYQQVAAGLQPSTRVIANLADKPVAATLANNAARKTTELRELVPTAEAKRVDELTEAELVPFRQSMVGLVTGGVGVFNDYAEAAKRLGYIYAAQGVPPADAARRAVRELVSDAYTFSGRLRIPKTQDADAIDRGLRNILANPDRFNVGVSEAERTMIGENFTREQVNAALRRSGFWVTLGDDSGVALFMEGTNGVRAVEGPNGQPITFTWPQILERATVPRAPRLQPQMAPETPGGAVPGRVIVRPEAR